MLILSQYLREVSRDVFQLGGQKRLLGLELREGLKLRGDNSEVTGVAEVLERTGT
jgi:hypothetical protein